MPTFTYKARDASGGTRSGSLSAADRKQVLQKLKAQRLQPVSVQEKGAAGSKPAAGAARRQKDTSSHRTFPEKGKEGTASGKPLADAAAQLIVEPTGNEQEGTGEPVEGSQPQARSAFQRSRPRRQVRLLFLKRLAELNSSGMPIGDCFRLLTQRLSDPQLSEIAHKIWRELSEGRSLGDSMRQLPEYFAEAEIAVIEAGEATGQLGSILDRVIAQMEEADAVRREVIGSLAYPLVVVFFATAVGLGMVFWLLPIITGILDTMGAEPNWMMGSVTRGAELSVTGGPFVLVGLFVAGLGLAQWRKSARGLRMTDRWSLLIPLLGPISKTRDQYQLASIVSTLTASGINMTETLRLTERTIANTELRARFHLARIQINEGLSFAAALRRHRVFPDLAVDILSVGENTGNLTRSLNEVGLRFRQELSDQLSLLIKIVTGAALGSAFTMVALVALGLISSVMQVSTSLSM